MRHLSTKQKAASSLLSITPTAEWSSEQKSNSCVTPEDIKSKASIGRTSSPEPCSKPCSSPEDSLSELAVCKCSTTSCLNCRKPNGPLTEEQQPPKANGPVDCNRSSDSCRQGELQHRLKPSTGPSNSSLAPTLPNHIRAETVKKEPESTIEICAQKISPTAPTIWTQQNHSTQSGLQEEKPSITSSARSETPPKGSIEHEQSKLGTTSPATGVTHLNQIKSHPTMLFKPT